MEIKIDPQQSRLFKDLIDFTQLNPQLALKRCEYAAAELAVRWAKKKNVIDFYKGEDLYLFDLTKYQLILEHQGAVKKMIQQIQELKLNKILEFGGGIGEFSLHCAESGLDITYHDLDGVIKNYAQWRFDKHQAPVKLDSQNPFLQEWDLVNVMDVLEHLENPKEVISQLGQKAQYLFCNPEEVRYNHFFPQHISKFDLTPYFEQVDSYLWKNKNISRFGNEV